MVNKLIYIKLEVIRSLHAGKIERLRANITLQPPADRQPAVDNSGHVVTSSQLCDYEVDNDVQAHLLLPSLHPEPFFWPSSSDYLVLILTTKDQKPLEYNFICWKLFKLS